MSRNLTRRQAMQMIGGAALAASPLRNALAADAPTLSPGTLKPDAGEMAKVEPFVHAGMNWSGAELNDFLAELPPTGILSLQQSLGLLPPDATIKSLHGDQRDISDFQAGLLWASTNILEYPLSDKTQIYYHELVKWVAGKAGVDQWIIDTQPTFLVERAYMEQFFATLWDKLTEKQRTELLAKIDTQGTLKYTAAIAALSGAGALAALSTTVCFAGFTFYTTMSVTICAAAGWFGVTVPFAAYASASTLVACLSGPFGWALLAVIAAAGVALAGRANAQKTAAAICQLHVLKVAALKDAGKSEDAFQVLGDPLKRRLVGKWKWRGADRTLDFDLKSDGSFTCDDHPDKRPYLPDSAGLVNSGKGDWSIRDGKLSVVMTHVWAIAFWKRHEELWIDDRDIVSVTPTQVDLRNVSSLKRQ